MVGIKDILEAILLVELQVQGGKEVLDRHHMILKMNLTVVSHQEVKRDHLEEMNRRIRYNHLEMALRKEEKQKNLKETEVRDQRRRSNAARYPFGHGT